MITIRKTKSSNGFQPYDIVISVETKSDHDKLLNETVDSLAELELITNEYSHKFINTMNLLLKIKEELNIKI